MIKNGDLLSTIGLINTFLRLIEEYIILLDHLPPEFPESQPMTLQPIEP